LSLVKSYATGTGLGSILVRSVTGTGFVRLAAMVASFAVGVQLARLLGPAGYGYYGIALSIVSLCGLPGEMGLPRLVTREVASGVAHKDPSLPFVVLRWADSMSTRISAVMVAGLAVAAFILSERGQSTLGLALLLGAPMIPLLTLARIRGGALQGFQFIVRGQIPDILARPILLSVLIFAAYRSGFAMTPAAAMALNSISTAAVLLLADAWLKQRLPPRPAIIARGERSWLASSIPMGLTEGMRVAQSELSILLLGIIARPAEVGLYRIASVTAFTAATPVAIINFVAFPIIARLYAEKDFERLQQALTKLAQAQFVGVAILALPLLAAPQFLLTLVFGAEFAPAADTLRILVVAQLISSAFGANLVLLNMTHHERRVTRAMAIALVLNLVALPILASLWSAIGAAIAVTCTLILWNVVTWLDAQRLLGLESSILPIAWTLQRNQRG
jgi:O-antigen/teichoic acid export membrane protein